MRRMFLKMLITAMMAFSGLVGYPGSSQAFEIGCPVGEPLCVCVLKDHDICKDPDGDGILSLYDNCRHVANRDQANCDGDTYGDACDSRNVVVTRRKQDASTLPTATGKTTCKYDGDFHSIFYSEVSYTTGYRTIETRRFCGPSGNAVENELVSEKIDTHVSWTVDRFGCDFVRGDSGNPGKLCKF